MSAEKETEKLADFIMRNYPEYIIDGLAGDVAIEIIKDLQILEIEQRRKLKNFLLRPEQNK